jgi:hypothetical protein
MKHICCLSPVYRLDLERSAKLPHQSCFLSTTILMFNTNAAIAYMKHMIWPGRKVGMEIHTYVGHGRREF